MKATTRPTAPRPGSSLDRMRAKLQTKSRIRKRVGFFGWLDDPANSEARELVRLWVEMLDEGTCDWSDLTLMRELRDAHGCPYSDLGRGSGGLQSKARAYFADTRRAS